MSNLDLTVPRDAGKDENGEEKMIELISNVNQYIASNQVRSHLIPLLVGKTGFDTNNNDNDDNTVDTTPGIVVQPFRVLNNRTRDKRKNFDNHAYNYRNRDNQKHVSCYAYQRDIFGNIGSS